MRKKKGPWVVTGSKTVYKNPWICVREDHVIQPDKKPGIFGVIEKKSGVSVIPIDAEGNIYLTEEYRYALGRRSIEAPSGGIDGAETPLVAAKRELKEEVGLTAKKWTDLGVINPFTSAIASPNFMYLAQQVSQGAASPEGTEQIRIIKMPLEKACRMVMESKITHGATCVAILKVQTLLGKRR